MRSHMQSTLLGRGGFFLNKLKKKNPNAGSYALSFKFLLKTCLPFLSVSSPLIQEEATISNQQEIPIKASLLSSSWSSWTKEWIGKLVALLSLWFAVNFWFTQMLLKKELKTQMDTWSEELSLEHLASEQKTWSQKILRRIQQDQRFVLMSGLGYHSSSAHRPLGSSLTLPIYLYNIPAGALEFVIPYQRILQETSRSPIFWWGGLILGILYTLLDLLRWLLKQVKRQNQMMQEHLAFRKKLTSQILHDLKSPLTLLRTLAETNTELSLDEYKLYLQKLDHRLQNILAELQWKPHYVATPLPKLPLNQVIQTLEHLIFQVSKETRQSITFHPSFSEELGHSVLIQGPINFILRIFQNLLVNAAEANHETHQTQLKIEAKTEKDYLLFNIEDEGPGFQCSFENLPYVSSSKGGNLRGSGLKIIHEALCILGGRVDFYKRTKGTFCQLKLPILTEH